MRITYLATLLTLSVGVLASVQLAFINNASATPFQTFSHPSSRTTPIADLQASDKNGAKADQHVSQQGTRRSTRTSASSRRSLRSTNATSRSNPRATGRTRPAQSRSNDADHRSRASRDNRTARTTPHRAHRRTTTGTRTVTRTHAPRATTRARRTTTTSRSTTVHVHRNRPARSRVIVAPRPRHTVVTRAPRTVHHHHHTTDTVVYTSPDTRETRPQPTPPPQTYLAAGLGVAGLASPSITATALPGANFHLAIGGKTGALGMELGFSTSTYSQNSNAIGENINLMGLSADLKLQPTLFNIFQPYILAGIGGNWLHDQASGDSSGGASLRLGLGTDIRIDNVALGARYLHNSYYFPDYGATLDATTASTDSIGINFMLYF